MFVHRVNSMYNFSYAGTEERSPVKHVKYGALGSLIIFELTVCRLADENIS